MKVLIISVLLIAAVSAKPSQVSKSLKPASLRSSNVGITNGEDAEVGQFPFQISYQWGLLGLFQHVCGGSIISPTWVLTAGHCVTQVPAVGDFKIVAGIIDLTQDSEEKQEINVIEKIVHPDFGGNVGPNDVALLHLEKAIEFGDLVQPVALPQNFSEPSGNVTLSGWGSTSTSFIPIMPNHLQTVAIPVLAFEDCNAAIEALLEDGEENPLSEVSNVCTGPLDQGISACSGDSGGPLSQDGTIVGIVSWGFEPCGSDGAPSVYTKVSSFVDFIQSHVDDLPTNL